MTKSPCTIAYITAGAGGMYCGSCLHDNTLARALTRLGVDVQLIPTYTPIRTDEENVSIDRIFFGGVNVFLEQRIPLYQHLPMLVGRLFDQPWLIRWATSRAWATSPLSLGALTVSMLRGTAGRQRREVKKLVSWLVGSVNPRLVVFSNMLISGSAPTLKEALGVPILVTLQGDDMFLEGLPAPYKAQAFEEIRRLEGDVDGFVVHSRYYADFMADYLGIPRAKLHLVPLGIDLEGFSPVPAEKKAGETLSCENAGIEPTDQIAATDQSAPLLRPASEKRPPTIGYLARLAPEKGLHLLVDAFIELRKRTETRNARLHIAGWLGEDHRRYAQDQFDKLGTAGLQDAFHYAGTVDRKGKIEFLRGLDVFSVPTTYREPKGLFVLEALAAGVPVVQPAHGAFPELLDAVGGGRLVPPNDAAPLADALCELLCDEAARRQLGRRGGCAVHERYNAESMARSTLKVFNRFLDS